MVSDVGDNLCVYECVSAWERSSGGSSELNCVGRWVLLGKLRLFFFHVPRERGGGGGERGAKWQVDKEGDPFMSETLSGVYKFEKSYIYCGYIDVCEA